MRAGAILGSTRSWAVHRNNFTTAGCHLMDQRVTIVIKETNTLQQAAVATANTRAPILKIAALDMTAAFLNFV